jgi:flagellar P-ring protein precursor FlgI
MRITRCLLALALGAAPFAAASDACADKLRDVADVSGARDNQLLGYGIITGLNGTGDDASAPFAAQSVLSMLRRLGVQVDAKQIRLRNVAAVLVTANIGAFAKTGTKLDITVSSIGNAKSLTGGVLVQTLLKGADQKTYAVAQGNILTGGFKAGGSSGSSVQSGSTTGGRIPEGAIVEREIVTQITDNGAIKLALRQPSFAVASKIVEAVDKELGKGSASADDGGSVSVKIPAAYTKKPVELIAKLEEVEVATIRKARVVVSERTQTIVAGGDVRLSAAVVVHGGLTIVVNEAPHVSQPVAPFGTGQTQVVPRTDIQTSEGDKTVRLTPKAATLADVASALGALGLSPRELASVLEAMRTAGALEAEVVIQ